MKNQNWKSNQNDYGFDCSTSSFHNSTNTGPIYMFFTKTCNYFSQATRWNHQFLSQPPLKGCFGTLKLTDGFYWHWMYISWFVLNCFEEKNNSKFIFWDFSCWSRKSYFGAQKYKSSPHFSPDFHLYKWQNIFKSKIFY